jgi:hypothetical protein
MIMTVSIVRIFLIILLESRVLFTPGRKNPEYLKRFLIPLSLPYHWVIEGKGIEGEGTEVAGFNQCQKE